MFEKLFMEQETLNIITLIVSIFSIIIATWSLIISFFSFISDRYKIQIKSELWYIWEWKWKVTPILYVDIINKWKREVWVRNLFVLSENKKKIFLSDKAFYAYWISTFPLRLRENENKAYYILLDKLNFILDSFDSKIKSVVIVDQIWKEHEVEINHTDFKTYLKKYLWKK